MFWMSIHDHVLSGFSRVQLFVTPWTVVCQTPLSMGFSRQEYWSGFAMPSSSGSFWCSDQTRVSYLLHWQAGSLPLALSGQPLNVHILVKICAHTGVTEMQHPGSLIRETGESRTCLKKAPSYFLAGHRLMLYLSNPPDFRPHWH